MVLKLVSKNRCFSGEQRIYSHDSKELGCEMKFAIYLPGKALDDEKSKGKEIFGIFFFPRNQLNFDYSSARSLLAQWPDMH